MSKPLRIIASAYACGPNWGSEIGMGWNWVTSLSNYCKLDVITELGFKKDIESKIDKKELKYKPVFHYVDVGDKGRRLFWEQGLLFYLYYKKWQKKAYDLANELIDEKDFDIVHQLNMIGFREPGYLWKIEKKPFVFGPVGGFNQFPSDYFSLLNTKDTFFYSIRNVLNKIQMNYNKRPHKAFKKAEYVVLATSTGMPIVSKYTKNTPIVITETGAERLEIIEQESLKDKEKIKFIWVGLVIGRKALPIALKAIAKSKYKDRIELDVVGDGANMDNCKNLGKELGLDNVRWWGKLENKKTKMLIRNSDMLFFTSLLEATSTVIFEALQFNTPVLCHDTCGFGNVIDEKSGIKISLSNEQGSVNQFSAKIDAIFENPEILQKLKETCSLRLSEYYWDQKALKMYKVYLKSLGNKKDNV